MVSVTIKPATNKIFQPIHVSRHRYVVMKGSAGSGKSVDTAQQYILRLLADKGRNLLCVRKAEVTNRDSTFAELVGAVNRLGFAHFWQVTTNPLQLRCVPNGNEIIFRGVNHEREREKLKSITFKTGKLTDVWIEEATELSQADVEIIDDRLRGELPPGLFYQMKLTFNPVSATHWIKAAYFDRADADVLTHHSTYLDNRFIDEAYSRRMMRRKELDPEGYRVYGLGEWGEVGGLILSNWRMDEFDTDDSRFDSIVFAQDFGFNHANVILDIGFKDGCLYVRDELYEYEKETNELIALAGQKGFNKRTKMWCDSAEPDRILMWRRAGYNAHGVKKEPNCVHAQIDFLKQTRIVIHPRCRNTLKEIQQWKWQFDDKRGIYLDEPVSFFDDAMAALRYAVEDMRRRTTVKVRDKSRFKGLV